VVLKGVFAPHHLVFIQEWQDVRMKGPPWRRWDNMPREINSPSPVDEPTKPLSEYTPDERVQAQWEAELFSD
jgi:hypothetical protein